jgi:hypothetical protein
LQVFFTDQVTHYISLTLNFLMTYYYPYSKRHTPYWNLFRFGRHKLLVARPHPIKYSCFCTEIALAMRAGKGERVWVCLLPLKGPCYQGNVEKLRFQCVDFKVHQSVVVVGSFRYSEIQTYLPAVKHLQMLGYQVVRLGDANMSIIEHKGVFDVTRLSG